MKTHIGVDAGSCLIQPVECTTAQLAHITMMKDCRIGKQSLALGDRGNHTKNRTIEHFEKEDSISIQPPAKIPTGGELTEAQKAFNQMLSAVHTIAELPFRVLKKHFGFTKVRYRGFKKNSGQIVTLFALANLWFARKRLLPLLGELRPRCGNLGLSQNLILRSTVKFRPISIIFMTVHQKPAACSANP